MTPSDIMPADLNCKEFRQHMDNILSNFIAAALSLTTNPKTFSPQAIKRNINTAQAIQKTCIASISLAPAAIEMGLSRQQVSNLLDGFSDELISYSRTGVWSGKYVDFPVTEDFRLALHKICEDGHCTGMSLHEVRKALGHASTESAKLILRRLGYGFYGPADSIVEETYIVPKNCGKELSPVLREVNDILKVEVAPMRESALRHKLHAERKELVDTAVAIMRHCPKYECTTSDGIGYYSLTWKELGGVQKRIERILWENLGKGMELKEIQKEYLSRLRSNRLNENPKLIVPKDSDKIGGANGLWKWKTDDGSNVIKDCRPFIRDFVVSKDAPVTLDEIVSYVSGLGVKLSQNSIKSYLTMYCTHRRKTDDYILKDIDAPSGRGDITMLIVNAIRKNGKALSVKELSNVTGVNVARIYRCFDKNPGIFVKTDDTPRNGGATYKVSPTWDGNRPSAQKSRKTPGYYELVRSATVQMLKGSKDKTLPMIELREKLSGLIPDIITSKNTALSKIMRRFDDFVVIGEAQKRKLVRLNPATHKADYDKPRFSLEKDWKALKADIVNFASGKHYLTQSKAGEEADAMLDIMGQGANVASSSYFHLMAEMLYGWFSGRLSERDTEYTRNLLALNYEQYLRNYYEMKTGYQLDSKPGLGTVVNDLRDESILPERYGGWMSDSISHIIHTRNTVAHPNKRDTRDRIDENIGEFLRLYLHTASLL